MLAILRRWHLHGSSVHCTFTCVCIAATATNLVGVVKLGHSLMNHIHCSVDTWIVFIHASTMLHTPISISLIFCSIFFLYKYENAKL